MAKQDSIRIIWAVDPFAKDKSLQRTTAWAIRALTKELDAGRVEVEPVYSLGAYPRDVPYETSRNLVDHVRLKGEEGLDDLLERVKIPGLRPLKVLADSAGTMRETVDQLVDYARESGAELIAASTRARKGLGRWMTGSFAESLMLRSDVPLFVVNPRWERTASLKRILFATDFSDESREAFSRVLRFAKLAGSEVTIFHKIDFNLSPGLEVAFAPFPPFAPLSPDVYEGETKARRENGRQWAEAARSMGVKAKVFVDSRIQGSAAEAILQYAKEHPGMIAMAGHGGAVSAAFHGSTTRQVERASVYPVWIVHSPAKAESARANGTLPIRFSDEEIMDDLTRHGRKKPA